MKLPAAKNHISENDTWLIIPFPQNDGRIHGNGMPLRNSQGIDVDLLNLRAGSTQIAEINKNIRHRVLIDGGLSSTSFQFYWTQNEVQVARLLGPLYYLYLVPIESDCDICRDRFVIISNPYADVLGSVDKWIVKSDVLLCRLRNSQALQDRLVEA